MNVAVASLSAATTLIAVVLGGWLTVRAQDRLWRRDHQRQWRDIRIEAYTRYLTAFREYIAYILRPATKVQAVPRPRRPQEFMPFFDETGSPYKERLEAEKTALRLIAVGPRVVRACNLMIRCARALAADRATCGVTRSHPSASKTCGRLNASSCLPHGRSWASPATSRSAIGRAWGSTVRLAARPSRRWQHGFRILKDSSRSDNDTAQRFRQARPGRRRARWRKRSG